MDSNSLNTQSDILASKLLCYHLIAEACTHQFQWGTFFSRIKIEEFGNDFLQRAKMG